MPRRNWSDGQEVVLADFNAINKTVERLVLDRLLTELMQRDNQGFFGSSFEVIFASSTSINVKKGFGIQEDLAQSSPEPIKRVLHRAVDGLLAIATPDATNDRIDLVVVKSVISNEISANRNFKPVSGPIVSQPFNLQLDFVADVQLVQGTPAASPVAPAVPAGFVKVAELLVTATSGLSGTVAITDFRNLYAFGGTFVDLPEAAVIPPSPTVGKRRVYADTSGALFQKDSSGNIGRVGSAGSGGSVNWNPVQGSGPILAEENGERVYLFEAAKSQKMTLFLKVPSGYSVASQINLEVAFYSPSGANSIFLEATSTLIKKNTDAVTTTANQHPSSNSPLTNVLANQLRVDKIDLTSVDGEINSIQVQPGDIIRVDLKRGTDTDLADIRFLPSSTEVSL